MYAQGYAFDAHVPKTLQYIYFQASGQSNLIQDRIAAAHRFFSYICLVAPMWTSVWANTSLPPNSISIGSSVFAGITSVLNKQMDSQTYSPRNGRYHSSNKLHPCIETDKSATLLRFSRI